MINNEELDKIIDNAALIDRALDNYRAAVKISRELSEAKEAMRYSLRRKKGRLSLQSNLPRAQRQCE